MDGQAGGQQGRGAPTKATGTARRARRGWESWRGQVARCRRGKQSDDGDDDDEKNKNGTQYASAFWGPLAHRPKWPTAAHTLNDAYSALLLSLQPPKRTSAQAHPRIHHVHCSHRSHVLLLFACDPPWLHSLLLLPDPCRQPHRLQVTRRCERRDLATLHSGAAHRCPVAAPAPAPMPLPMPGSPSASRELYWARLKAVFKGADPRVCAAFWLFGMSGPTTCHLNPQLTISSQASSTMCSMSSSSRRPSISSAPAFQRVWCSSPMLFHPS